MCTSFDPSLLQFRQAAQESAKDLELIYVPSDRTADAALERTRAMNMVSVPFGKEADKLKKRFGVWAGAEAVKFGRDGRRSGVPALVVLNAQNGEELAFVPAEAQGAKALGEWPLDDEKGIW